MAARFVVQLSTRRASSLFSVEVTASPLVFQSTVAARSESQDHAARDGEAAPRTRDDSQVQRRPDGSHARGPATITITVTVRFRQIDYKNGAWEQPQLHAQTDLQIHPAAKVWLTMVAFVTFVCTGSPLRHHHLRRNQGFPW